MTTCVYRARMALGLAVAFLATLYAVPLQAQSDRMALVLGNGRYLHTPPLANPTNDAREVAKALCAIGFDVLQRTDLNRASMAQGIAAFFISASSARVVLLFYAGHGIQIAGRNYMVPVDASLDTADAVTSELIEVDSMVSNLDSVARANIVILDACRDNPLARKLATTLGTSRSMTVQSGFAAYSPTNITSVYMGTGVLIAFSTAPGTVALDGIGSNSPFTTALINHLNKPGLEVRQMLTRVRAEVALFVLHVEGQR